MEYDTSIKEAAAQLGISVQAVHKRIAAGTLEAQKLNRRWLVSSKSLEAAKGNAPKPGRPRKGEAFLLMNADYPIMDFTYNEERQTFRPLDVHDASGAPIGTVTRTGAGSAAGLKNWWEHRGIPGNRIGIDRKLAELGIDNPALIPFRNHGFSLSDQYWIKPVGQELEWSDLNYFQNDFGDEGPWDEWLSNVGLSTPDNTSEGVLPKKWVCENGRRVLLKGHIPWTDQQVYNESVATALHRRLLTGNEFVEYSVRHVEGLGVVSACPCFIRPNEEYVPASLVHDAEGVRRGESVYDAVLRQSSNLGIPISDARMALSKMVVCDGIIANTDRHLRNFGFIRNIDTLEWRFAPLFDSGNSLWYDKDEGQVAQGDYSYVARPFEALPNGQLMLAARDSWFEIGLLDGFEDEAAAILEAGNLSRWRLDYLKAGIQKQIDVLRVIWG